MTEPLRVDPRLIETVTPNSLVTEISTLQVGWTVPRILSVGGELFVLTDKICDREGDAVSWVFETPDRRRRLTVYND